MPKHFDTTIACNLCCEFVYPVVQLGVSCIHVACISTSARTLLATYVVISSLLLCKSLAAMSHTKIDDFKQALAGASEVIRLQTTILTAEQMDKVLIGLQDSLLIKAASLPAISIQQVQDIVEQVRVSVLTEGQKSKLTTVLTSRCMAGIGEETGAATKAQCQSMQAPSRYLTGQDWKELQDPHRSCMSKCSTLCARMRSVGMTHPTEGTYRQLAGVIVGTHCRDGSVDQWFGIVKELKAIFVSKKADKVSVVRMHVFPEGPDSLPECIYQFAYPDPEDPPKLMELDGMQHIVSAIPLRISNKAVLHMAPKAPPHVPMHLAAPGMMPFQPTQPFQQPGENFLHQIASLLANPDLQRQLAGTPGIFAGAPQPPAITMLSGAGRQNSMLPLPHAATLALEGSTGASSSAMALSPTGALALSPSAEPKPDDRAASMLDRMEALAQGGKELEAARKEAAKLEAAALEAAKPGPKPKAKAKAQPKATAKGKGKPKAMVKAKAKGKGKAEPKTKAKGKAAPKAGKLLLGCSKCRGHLVHDACYLHGGLASHNSL